MTTTLISLGGNAPQVADTAFIAPGCRLIGDVHVADQASIWYNCVLRGDVNRIRIGPRTNIQDGSVIHVDSAHGTSPGYPTIIGADVLVGHMALIHGSVLDDRAFVGLGAIVMDGCRIHSEGMLGAGALLPPGKTIGPRELWLGRPARFVRLLSDAEVAMNAAGVAHYTALARIHREANEGPSALSHFI